MTPYTDGWDGSELFTVHYDGTVSSPPATPSTDNRLTTIGTGRVTSNDDDDGEMDGLVDAYDKAKSDAARKPYTAPKLVAHGTVAQLTQGTTSEGCPSELVAVLSRRENRKRAIERRVKR